MSVLLQSPYSLEIVDVSDNHYLRFGGQDYAMMDRDLRDMIVALRKNGATLVHGSWSTDDDYVSFFVAFDAIDRADAVRIVRAAEDQGAVVNVGDRIVRSGRRIIA